MGTIVLALAAMLYQLALSTLRWSMPFKLVGVLSLVIAAGGIYMGGRALIAAIMRVGVKGLSIRLVVVYILSILLTGLLVPSLEDGIAHWRSSVRTVNRTIGQRLGDIGRAIIAVPDALSFAATGRRAPVVVSGTASTASGEPTPIVVQLVPVGGSSAGAQPSSGVAPTSTKVATPAVLPIQIGATVRVFGTDGTSLRVRVRPGADAPIVTRFPPGSEMQIVDGPQTVNGSTWWKVQGTQGEGWCSGEFLTSVS